MKSMVFEYEHIETRKARISAPQIIDALLQEYLRKLGGEFYEIMDGKKTLMVERHTSHSWDEKIRELTEKESNIIDALLRLREIFCD